MSQSKLFCLAASARDLSIRACEDAATVKYMLRKRRLSADNLLFARSWQEELHDELIELRELIREIRLEQIVIDAAKEAEATP